MVLVKGHQKVCIRHAIIEGNKIMNEFFKPHRLCIVIDVRRRMFCINVHLNVLRNFILYDKIVCAMCVLSVLKRSQNYVLSNATTSHVEQIARTSVTLAIATKPCMKQINRSGTMDVLLSK